MKCPKCGSAKKGFAEGDPVQFECRTIIWTDTNTTIEDTTCLRNQLAAKSVECDEWKLKYELATTKCTCEFVDGPTLASCVERCVAALSRAKGEEDGR